MTQQLGTLEELPLDYRASLTGAGVTPLWPMMRNVLPHNAPQPITKSQLWAFKSIKPLLLKAGELTPVEKAERRVLVLSDPGRGNAALQATATIYAGLQLLLPGESAPAHRHTPSAARIVVEGTGAYTVVNGEKLPMSAGDLILTPGGTWHDHGHDGADPVIWLDALDLPLYVYLEGSYAEEAELQSPRNRPDAALVEYAASGLVPSRRRDQKAPDFPLMRYPWDRTEAALRQLATYTDAGQSIELDFVNPETGESCLRVLGFTAMMLRAGETVRPPKRSQSALFHVVKGRGHTLVDGKRIDWTEKDTFSVPVFAALDHVAEGGDAFLMRVHDQPLQEKMGYYEERNR